MPTTPILPEFPRFFNWISALRFAKRGLIVKLWFIFVCCTFNLLIYFYLFIANLKHFENQWKFPLHSSVLMTDKQIWGFFVSTNEKVLHVLFNMSNSPKEKFEHNQRFFEKQKQLFHCFMTSRTYVYCKIYCIDILVAHGGKGNLTKHVKSNKFKHVKLSKMSETNGKITNSFTSLQ